MVSMKRILRVGAAGIALAASGLPAIAYGQESGASEDDLSAGEIVVTARRTEEKLADIPLAITAFSSEDLERANIEDLNDVAAQTPGLVFTSIIGEFLPTPTIRGVGQTDLFATEPNVAIYVDGVYQGAREGLNISQLAIERIEVVKGPQSSLYGRNSFAGAINIVTQAPRNEFGGSAGSTFGEDGRLELRGSVTGPLIQDVLSVRLSGAFNRFKGSYQNATGGPRLGGSEFHTFAGALRFTPSSNFTADARVYYSDDEISPPAVSALAPNCEPTTAGAMQTYCGTIPDRTAMLSSNPMAFGQRRESWRTSLNLEYALDSGWTFTSLSGYNNMKMDGLTDLSRGQGSLYQYNRNPAVIPPNVATFRAEMLRRDFEVKVDEFSQEFRISSPDSAPIRGGLGYFHYEFDRSVPTPDVTSLTALPADFRSFMPAFAGNPVYLGFFDPAQITTTVNLSINDNAVFGYLEGDLGSKVTLRGELRYTHEKQDFSVTPGATGQLKNDSVTGRASLQYRPGEDTLVYASVANGEKAGGIDENKPSQPFGPERNWSYELGVKQGFADGRGLFDVALFYIDRSDLQTPVLDPTLLPRPDTVVVNVGTAHSVGVEAQLRYRLSEALSVNLGGTYTDAKFDSGIISSFATFSGFGPNGDISGQPMGRTSKVQLNGSLDFQAPLTGKVDWFWRLDGSYQSKQYMDPTALTTIPSRAIVNLRAGVETGGLRIEAFAENLFNEDSPTSAFRDVYFGNYDTGAARIFPYRVTLSYGRQRLLGGRVTYRF